MAAASRVGCGSLGLPVVDMIEVSERTRCGELIAASCAIMPPIHSPNGCCHALRTMRSHGRLCCPPRRDSMEYHKSWAKRADNANSHAIRRHAMADKSNDPAVIWQTMIGEMEKGFNTFANQAMTSPEFSRVMNQAGGVSAGVQKQLAELMEKYLTGMNLPSRAQMVGLGERLQTIESQLNEITSLLR